MRKLLIPLLIFLLAGAYYWRQACPTFYYWDSAELTAAVLGGGVPHPPGFPFFLIMAKLWQLVTPLNPFFSLNIFAAFFGAIGLVIWYMVISRTLSLLNGAKSHSMIWLVSLLSVTMMAVSLTYSIQATRFEVYSLNFAGFAALILICLKIIEHEKPSAPWTIALFLLLGLLLAVHNLTIALAIPGLLLFLILNRKITISYAILGILTSFLLAGLFYLLLIFRAANNPPLNWGDPSNMGRLIDYILIKGFSVSASRLSLAHLGAQFIFAYDLIYRQIGPAALALALFGMGYTVWRRPDIGIPLVLILILNLFSVAFAENYFYENYDLHGYLTISLAISIIFLAVAFGVILKYMLSRLPVRKAAVPRTLALTVFLIFAMLVTAPQIQDNYLSADLSRVKGAEEYAAKFLSDSPRNSVIITSSYNTYFCLLAYRSGPAAKDNRVVMNVYNWDHQWGRERSAALFHFQSWSALTRQSCYRDLLNQTMSRRPVYIEYDEASAPINRYLYPSGLGYIFINPDSTLNVQNKQNDESNLFLASSSTDLETVRTWAFWLENRGEFYRQRGDLKNSRRYFALINSLASAANLK